MSKKSRSASTPPLVARASAGVPALDALMAQGQALERAGRMAEAEGLYREVLRRAPRHADALHSLALVGLRTGHPGAAAELIGQSLAVDPSNADAHANLGYALQLLGRLDDALAALDRALALRPGSTAALNNRGNVLSALGRHDEAIAALERACALRPDDVQALYNRGNALHAAGRLEDALAAFDAVLARHPDIAQAHNNRGRALHDLGRAADARAAYERALALQPESVEAQVGRGAAALALGEAEPALADVDAVLRRAPDHVGALYGRGCALLALNRRDEAVAAFGRCLALAPDHLDARINRGNALHAARRHEEAIADFDAVLRATPAAAGVASNRGDALLAARRYVDAAAAFEGVLAIDPDWPYALGKQLHARMLACDWRDLPGLLARVDAGVAAGRRVIEPFAYNGVATSPDALRRCAEIYAADQFPPRPALAAPGRARSPGRLRLGYLCGEFRHQATAILAAELFELHDKSRFELFAFDNGWDDGSPLRRRIEAAFDHLVDISAMSDDAAAAAIAGRGIDLLVNLNGWFGLGRTGVFARRPAPVQVNFLGFPGTIGAPYIDAIVADAHVIPPGEEGAYVERVVRLPACYQPNDRRRAIAAEAPTRAQAGLPPDAVVLACFNNGYKITPGTFAAWMRVLRAVDAAVLWLLKDDDAAAANLRAGAASHGVDPARLHFAARAPLDEHLARHALADLFLDTLPYNAHTTASDALWAGLPLLSCRGSTFPGRVGASLLHALGLHGELLAEDEEDYVARAIALASDPAARARLRAALAQRRGTAALFDTPAYARHLEDAFTALAR
jgi:predicted O-linked N-acetylglucosamine transferase (SPINDLY family)